MEWSDDSAGPGNQHARMSGITSTTGYLLCCSPRSGSTLLCDLLARSGVAGAPESYFREASIPEYSKRWRLEFGDQGWDDSYLRTVRAHGERSTGVFGMRIMWSDMQPLLSRLADLHPGDQSDRARLRSALGVERFVHLTRQDRVAQAVSLVIAAQTGLWHRNADGTVRQGAEPVAPPRYDRGRIADELRMLEAGQQAWTTWFSEQSIMPLKLSYEELSADPAGTTRILLDHLGVRTVDVPTVATAKLATSTNAAWVERFRAKPD